MARIKTLPKVLLAGIITVAAGFGINAALDKVEKKQPESQVEQVQQLPAQQAQSAIEQAPQAVVQQPVQQIQAQPETTSANAGLSKLLQTGGK